MTGEHYVCYLLARHGWAASLTREGLQRCDLLAVHAEDRRVIEIEVKSASPTVRPIWHPGASGLIPAATDHEWFIFVQLHGDLNQVPTCYVVPRNDASAGAWIWHESWRTDPNAAPGTRNTPVKHARIPATPWQRYAGAWDQLRYPSTDQPVRLPPWMRAQALDPALVCRLDTPGPTNCQIGSARL